MIRLASGSETRAKLLEKAGIEFIQSPVEFDEDALVKRYKNPVDFVCAAARGKLQKAVEQYGLDIPIVSADTVVAVGDEILRKAKNQKEALEILRKQSGSQVDIVTCMIYKDKQKEIQDLDKTSYIFAPFDEKDLLEYIQSGEWRGKAGACMVEGFCKKYIKDVRGRESTAMGLQVERLQEITKNI